MPDQRLRELEQAFLTQGGFTQRLYNAGQQARQRQYSRDLHSPHSGLSAKFNHSPLTNRARSAFVAATLHRCSHTRFSTVDEKALRKLRADNRTLLCDLSGFQVLTEV
jgi:hypothetical protein